MLGRRAGIGLGSHDVYANLAGGLRSTSRGSTCPLALALASSLRDRPVAPGTVAIGEVGLLGELRPVGGLERRLREAARLGFDAGDRAAPARGPAPASSVAGLRDHRASGRCGEAIARGASATTAAPRGEPSPAMLG